MERYYKKWFTLLTLPAIVVFGMVVVDSSFIFGVLYSFTGWRGTYSCRWWPESPRRWIISGRPSWGCATCQRLPH